MQRVDFRVRGERYGVPARRVLEVIPKVVLRPVAGAPAGIAGLFVYRGWVTPVVDLSLLVAGVPTPDRLSSRIMVFELGGKSGGKRLVGLLAEGVTAVSTDTEEPQRALALPGAPFLGDVTRDADGLVQMVEPEALIPGELHETLLLEAADEGGANGSNPRRSTAP